jgi:hypothetical protein
LNVHDCMQVLPDGRFHLERRIQQLPSPSATLRVFDSWLDTAHFRKLQEILKDEKISELPPYVQPEIPMTAPRFRGVKVDIPRGTQVQSVGYWLWKGGTSDSSPNNAPDNIKTAWRDSESAMRPLVDWLHCIEALNLGPSNSASTMCGTTDPEKIDMVNPN